MSRAIRIHTRVESETLTLAELKPFVGKSVEITVREESPSNKRPDVELMEKLAKEIDFDEAAFHELRRISIV
jgi:hypothetical protein